MNLIDLLTPSEITQVIEGMPFLEPNDFQKAFEDLAFKEITDYGYSLNLPADRFICNMAKRAEKLGGTLI